MYATTWNVDPVKKLTRREVAHVLNDLACRAPRSSGVRMNRVIFHLECCCGLWVSEISALRLEDVHVAGGRPHLRVGPEGAKGGRARVVPLWWDAGTLADLTVWKREREDHGASQGDPFVCCLWSRCFGRHLIRHTVRERFRTACKGFDLERLQNLTIHHGRHTFISHALAGGRTLAEVRVAAGHRNLVTTSAYLHIAVDDDATPGHLFGQESGRESMSPFRPIPSSLALRHPEANVDYVLHGLQAARARRASIPNQTPVMDGPLATPEPQPPLEPPPPPPPSVGGARRRRSDWRDGDVRNGRGLRGVRGLGVVERQANPNVAPRAGDLDGASQRSGVLRCGEERRRYEPDLACDLAFSPLLLRPELRPSTPCRIRYLFETLGAEPTALQRLHCGPHRALDLRPPPLRRIGQFLPCLGRQSPATTLLWPTCCVVSAHQAVDLSL
ncbi:MAG: site-specific integrase [Planctomycetes bacterium]|nr:site-specific integrase [Planctomycetota bacterium]